MAWDPVWEQVFSSQAWGRYPGEDIIRFVAKNFFNVSHRASVRFLEVGFGTGSNLWFLAREGFQANGIEGSRRAEAIARERLDNDCPGWNRAPQCGELIVGDMMSLDWEDETFDACIDSEAVYCNDFEDSCQIYKEMYRVTKPGGKLFVRTFATGCYGDGLGDAVGINRYIANSGPLAGKGPSRFTSKEEIGKLLGPWRVKDSYLITRSLDSDYKEVREWIVFAEKS